MRQNLGMVFCNQHRIIDTPRSLSIPANQTLSADGAPVPRWTPVQFIVVGPSQQRHNLGSEQLAFRQSRSKINHNSDNHLLLILQAQGRHLVVLGEHFMRIRCLRSGLRKSPAR